MWPIRSRQHVSRSAQKRSSPSKRRSFIGLPQLQRLLRCAPCQGTYLGRGATPCIHLHLTQPTSRDLISASLKPRQFSSSVSFRVRGPPADLRSIRWSPSEVHPAPGTASSVSDELRAAATAA